jgi:hypothetical protein
MSPASRSPGSTSSALPATLPTRLPPLTSDSAIAGGGFRIRPFFMHLSLSLSPEGEWAQPQNKPCQLSWHLA